MNIEALRESALKYRTVHDFTQEQMGERIGVTRNTYSRFENGVSDLRPTNRERLRQLLHFGALNETDAPLHVIAKRFREAAQITPKEFAVKIGLDPNAYAQFERGAGDVSSHILRAIQEVVSFGREEHLRAAETQAPYGDPDPAPESPPTEEKVQAATAFRQQLIHELHDLADVLNTDSTSGELHARKFASQIAYYHQSLDEYTQALTIAGKL